MNYSSPVQKHDWINETNYSHDADINFLPGSEYIITSISTQVDGHDNQHAIIEG